MAIIKRPLSPRQKMINLMYVVLMAMLALNVSSEVLDGFAIVEEGIRHTTANTERQNQLAYATIWDIADGNPEKNGTLASKAARVEDESRQLYNFIQELKDAIVLKCDGVATADGTLSTLQAKDDLEAAAQIMLSPASRQGYELFQRVNEYREAMVAMMEGSVSKTVVQNVLATDINSADGRSWEQRLFDQMPAAAAITILSKLQADVRYAEGEVLKDLMAAADRRDAKIDQMQAFVIPEATTVFQGGTFTARIVMAAVDTLRETQAVINGREVTLRDGLYEMACDKTGTFSLKGSLRMHDTHGTPYTRTFSHDFTVLSPAAVASADLTNVLYAGYDNPVSVSVPGVPATSVSATVDGAALRKVADGRYIITPRTGTASCNVSIWATQKEQRRLMGQYTFRVRSLPEPAPFIAVKDEGGTTTRYRGGSISRSTLLTSARTLSAAVDDGMLDVPFRVQSFEMVVFDGMGNAVPTASEGGAFSQRQRDQIRRMPRGTRFYVSRIVATGPDGVQRRLSTSMEIIIR